MEIWILSNRVLFKRARRRVKKGPPEGVSLTLLGQLLVGRRKPRTEADGCCFIFTQQVPT